jgi:prephenate dehydrogenase
MNVFVIGVGLIGGSMVLDIKSKYPEAIIYGIDSNENHLNKALEIGIIEHKATFQELEKAAIVIVSIPVDVQLTLLPKVLDIVSENTLVLDVGSTKEQICAVLENHPKRRNYLATHPIAGTEFSGPMAAHVGLFNEKTNIICEVEKTAFKLQEKALEIFSKLGMRIRYMDAKAHDKHIAYVSHLSHISSFMLGKTVIEKEKNERDIFDMAGSGFASTVRLAKSSNKSNVIEILEEYINNLQRFNELMKQNDFAEIYNEMESTNHIKQILNGIK